MSGSSGVPGICGGSFRALFRVLFLSSSRYPLCLCCGCWFSFLSFLLKQREHVHMGLREKVLRLDYLGCSFVSTFCVLLYFHLGRKEYYLWPRKSVFCPLPRFLLQLVMLTAPGSCACGFSCMYWPGKNPQINIYSHDRGKTASITTEGPLEVLHRSF
jgi:hypothetical protein